ncbi:hypothetical protein GH714_025817 [Hevea brasiliensis]|uniref:DUF7650 domain-containing protein n=1 Tax=Hevea brasiliensis TaxID=3981 RepID=A0A6A6M1T3_HEVBR|nr:hypothetical protein GH714_025817 [Hevea brasiliensis]
MKTRLPRLGISRWISYSRSSMEVFQIEPIAMNNDGNSIEESSFQQLIPPSSPDKWHIGDPQVNPRVGNEYQAEIPPMISESHHFQLSLDPFDSKVTVDGSHSFLIGLPIPITWIHDTINDRNEGCRMSNPDDSIQGTRSSKSRTTGKNNILEKKGSKQNAEPTDLGLDDGNEPKPVSMAFSEGKFSLEDYVSNLKAIAGIKALVDAIGITCSSLTSSDIIKLLTGGFRLSKARCNDIFWEAVWPRLLARGWHSEQPNNQGCMGSNHPIVFLIPGVKKFSKRKLVKGNHYFDSVSDVLSKVASEPKLIELETEEARGSSCNEENRWVAGVPLGHNDASIRQSFHYLKPRVSNYNLNLVKFTVVDSGLVDERKLSRMREMRYTPDDLNVKSLLTKLSSSIEMMFSEKSLNDNETEAVDMSLDGGKNVRRELRYSPVDIIVTSEITKSLRKKESDSSEDLLDGHVRDATKMLSREEKNGKKCSHNKDVIDSSGSEQKALNREIRNKFVESLQGSLEENTGGLVGATCFGAETSHGENVKLQTPSLIDLNLPQFSLDCENDEPALMNVESSPGANADHQCFLSNSDKTDPGALSASVDDGPAIEQPSLNPRRQSTRNRPLTTRALEALECGFLSVKRQKTSKVHAQEISFSSSSHRVHSKAKVTPSRGNVGSGIVNAKDGNDSEAFNKKDSVQKTPDRSEEKC